MSREDTKALYSRQTEWTDDRVALLRQLHADGLSASQIAAMVGNVSRNAVIGKLHRIGLASRGVTPKRTKPRKPSTGARRSSLADMTTARKLGMAQALGANSLAEALKTIRPEPKQVAGPAWEALPGTTPIPLLIASDEVCRWPIGDPLEPGFGFCGCAVSDGSVYCAAHRARGTTTFKATAADKRKLEKSDLSRRIFA